MPTSAKSCKNKKRQLLNQPPMSWLWRVETLADLEPDRFFTGWWWRLVCSDPRSRPRVESTVMTEHFTQQVRLKCHIHLIKLEQRARAPLGTGWCYSPSYNRGSVLCFDRRKRLKEWMNGCVCTCVCWSLALLSRPRSCWLLPALHHNGLLLLLCTCKEEEEEKTLDGVVTFRQRSYDSISRWKQNISVAFRPFAYTTMAVFSDTKIFWVQVSE